MSEQTEVDSRESESTDVSTTANHGKGKLSPAERISLYEAKAQAYAAKAAHYNKKAGQIKRLLRELGIETI